MNWQDKQIEKLTKIIKDIQSIKKEDINLKYDIDENGLTYADICLLELRMKNISLLKDRKEASWHDCQNLIMKNTIEAFIHKLSSDTNKQYSYNDELFDGFQIYEKDKKNNEWLPIYDKIEDFDDIVDAIRWFYADEEKRQILKLKNIEKNIQEISKNAKNKR